MNTRQALRYGMIILMTLLIIIVTYPIYSFSPYCEWKVVNMLESASAKIYNIVMNKLDIKDVTHALLLTDLKYSEVDGYDLYPLSYYFTSHGFVVPYNAVPVHAPVYSIPWIFVYYNDTRMSIYIEFSRECLKNVIDSLCSGKITISEASSMIVRKCISKMNILSFNINSIVEKGLKEPSKMWNYLTEKLNKYAAFSIVTITAVWSHDAPALLLLASELHNHICPGLLSGFLMYKYLMMNKLITSRDKVYIIASPVYCKDDVYVQLFDASPGKRRIIVKLLPWSEQDEISKILGGNVAGIVIAYDPETDTGRAYILAFNWTKVHIYLKKYHTSFHGPSWWVSRVIADLYMLKYVNQPDYFVKVLKTIDFRGHVWRYPSLFYELGRAGVDPYVALGVIHGNRTSRSSISAPASASARSTYSPSIVYAELGVIIILIIIIIIMAMMYRKRKH
ncbi:MAG: hypothetical protein GXO10_07155 [Crenarchaeota archaeon]|nr:hypothetical protein [Thermoproteota archaeon]